MYIPKTTDIIQKFYPSGARGRPLCYFPFPFVAYFSIIIIKVNIFIIGYNMSLRICYGMGYNQYDHTHISGIIRSE